MSTLRSVNDRGVTLASMRRRALLVCRFTRLCTHNAAVTRAPLPAQAALTSLPVFVCCIRQFATLTALEWSALLCLPQIFVVRQGVGGAAFTAAMVAMANSVPTRQAGAVFGLAQTIVSLGQCLSCVFPPSPS